MKHMMLLALCAMCLALMPITGCDSESASDDIAACKAAGGCGATDDGGPDNGSGGTDELLTGMVSATAPLGLNGQPLMGDFYYGDTLTCEGVSTCEASVTGSISIEFKCPNHLFLAKTATGSAKFATHVTWDKPGDWGLAPQGTYRENDGYEHAVKTVVEQVNGQHQILLYEDEDVIGIVDGQAFSWVRESGVKTVGTVSDDLKTIVYQVTLADGQTHPVRTLTLIE